MFSLDRLSDRSWTEGSGPRPFQVALVTFGILALELALIRWLSGQVRMLAYFNNLILIASFLGMGLGLLLGPRWPGLVHLTLPALAALAIPTALAPQLGLTHLTFPDPSVHLWGAESQPAGLLPFLGTLSIVMAFFLAVVAVLAAAGAAVGVLVQDLPGLEAYGADLIGSLLGVLSATALSALGTSPPWWLALGALPFAWLSRAPISLAAAAVTVLCGQLSIQGAVYSPYNRIDLSRSDFGLTLSVNRDFHQYLHDLSNVEGDPLREKVKRMYDLPFAMARKRDRALIAGAGTGNDVRAALRQGFGHVVSVDIDGRILELGKQLHPERPYDDPRAERVNDDARAYFERYRGEPFDVVCFGFVDSHAMFSALGTLRLDNFLYTEQGLRAAWKLVAPEGHLTVALSFIAGPWLEQRVYWTLARATGVRPMIVAHDLHGGATFVAARPGTGLRAEALGDFPLHAAPSGSGVLTTSDDWPFLYLRPGVVPWGYLAVLASVLACAALLVGGAAGWPARGGFDLELFLLGAAFLLLETRGVTALSLLFGSTWVVNSAVFAGVLIVALMANLVVSRSSLSSLQLPFLLLLGTVALLAEMPIGRLNQLDLWWRGLAGGVLVVLPVGFAGIVVSSKLRSASDFAPALASNILGSVLGGCLEYVSMYAGLANVARLALATYLFAFLLERRRRAPGVPARA